ATKVSSSAATPPRGRRPGCRPRTIPAVNFARDVVEAAPPDRIALVALGREGGRSEISFAQVADRAARLAGALAQRGVGRGDVVMTLIGNRPEWVYALVACFRIGAVALP